MRTGRKTRRSKQFLVLCNDSNAGGCRSSHNTDHLQRNGDVLVNCDEFVGAT